MDWNLRSCGRNGHVTYAPDEPELRSQVHTDTPLGVAWRCLRCGDYVLGEPEASGPAENAPQVRRGKALRDVVILRLLAVERGIRGLLVLLAAWGVYHFRGSASRGDIQSALDKEIPILKQAGDVLHVKLDLENSSMVHTIRKVLEADSSTITLVAVGLAVYGILQLVEGTGLWLIKRWGEYFAVVATSLGLPIEIYELTEKITWVRIVALLINIAAVVYLLLSKRLFGLRGGHAAYEAERHEANLLEVEVAAEASKIDRKSIKAVSSATSSAPVD